MHRNIGFMLALCGTMVGAGAAQAITVQTAADLSASLAAGKYSGVGSLGRLTATGGSGHKCTGALVASNVVLTAAHCLDGDVSARFFLPAAGDFNAQGGKAYSFASSFVFKDYLGNGDSDLAVITLAEIAGGHDIYDLYTEKDELGQEMTMVGAGLQGVMSEGYKFSGQDYKLREGVNRFDATESDFMNAYYIVNGYGPQPRVWDDVLLFDFDSGRAENDTFGRHLGINDTGVVSNGKLVESGILFGDSGGPNFINGRIAGVNSFMGTGGYFVKDGINACGTGQPGNTDTVAPSPWGCSDGSWGDFGGSTRVSFYHEQIRSYIAAAAVPEPASWATMIAGFGIIGTQMRRRRRPDALTPVSA